MLAGVMALGVVWGRSVEAWRTGARALLVLGASARWEGSEIGPTLATIRQTTIQLLEPVTLSIAAVLVAAFSVALVQTGGLSFHPEAIGFKLERVNPIANAANLFSLRALTRLLKSLVPVALLGVFAVRRLVRETTIPPFSTGRLTVLGEDVYGLMTTAAWLLFGLSLVDYVVEWRSRESRLKMSREDLRQEYKESEGSPQIRSRIRSLQRQMRRRKVKEDVAKATVVVTNPTHYAVALGFDFVAMDAPKVMAKGRNLLAEEIKAEARWAGVPILENPPLARSLYRTVEVGQSIPVALYAAVASILAYLYRQRMEAERRQTRMREGAQGTQADGTAATQQRSGRGPDSGKEVR
jgi:flagellar biosynthetic protein FlhB